MTAPLRLRRIYHPYHTWEDFRAGMWRHPSADDMTTHFQPAIAFTGDAERYGAWMLHVTREWPRACEHNLTNVSINRKAWVGHAACCLALGCPELITRLAWHQLTQQQQDDANAAAAHAITAWETAHRLAAFPLSLALYRTIPHA